MTKMTDREVQEEKSFSCGRLYRFKDSHSPV